MKHLPPLFIPFNNVSVKRCFQTVGRGAIIYMTLAEIKPECLFQRVCGYDEILGECWVVF